ncbi:MAG: fatty acid--CoA ligase family protein, partial [Thermoanaerobaculia bacterium]|nr:fatty acid--CoA ligase family protein [Thermoanaerobaculia bacterium]
VEVRLVGSDGRDRDDEGELWVRSPGLMRRYLNLDEATRARMGDGWDRSGDVVRRDEDGFHYFVSRADDMLVCGGENVYPAEVEALLERHGEVAQAAVVAIADEIKGQLPVAFVVRRPGAAVAEEDLKRFALANAPAYQHPRRVWFVDELPLAGTKKVDRAALVARAAEAS